MLEKLIYKNHRNEEISIGHDGIYVRESDLHDYAWTVKSKNDRISSFKKGVVKKTIPIVIKCTSEEEGIRVRNSLFEAAEKDVLAMQYGRIIIGDYYLKCYVTGSKKSDYLKNKNHMQVSLTINTDMPFWIKETTTTFYDDTSGGEYLDYNSDFPMDYASTMHQKTLNNSNFIPSNFRMVIYGECVNPSITIAGHEYRVNVTVSANEYLTIDSAEKTIILTHTDGTTENYFHARNRASYVFEQIPTGISNVESGSFIFDITILEERSEPKWT